MTINQSLPCPSNTCSRVSNSIKSDQLTCLRLHIPTPKGDTTPNPVTATLRISSRPEEILANNQLDLDADELEVEMLSKMIR